MPTINMIAPRRMEKLRLEKRVRYLVAVLLAELVLAVIIGMGFSYKLWGTMNQISNYDTQLTKLKPVVAEIELYRDSTKKLTPKLDLLNEARVRTMSWYGMLDKMMETLPANCHLIRISIVSTPNTADSSGGQTQQLTILGVAQTQAKVGEAILRLQKVPELKNVELHYSQTPVGGVSSNVEFEIGAEFNSRK